MSEQTPELPALDDIDDTADEQVGEEVVPDYWDGEDV